MMEDGLEARSHNFGTGCQYCGVDYGRKVDAVLIPSLRFFELSPLSMMAKPTSRGIRRGMGIYRNRLCLVLGYH